MESRYFKIVYLGKNLDEQGWKFTSSTKIEKLLFNVYSMNNENNKQINYSIWDLTSFYQKNNFNKYASLAKKFMDTTHALIVNEKEIGANLEAAIKNFYEINNNNCLGIIIGESKQFKQLKNIENMNKALKYLNENIANTY